MTKTVFEYIKEQEKSFEEKPFTPADAVILDTLANINFSYFYDKIDAEYVPLGLLCEDFVHYCDLDDNSSEIQLLKLIKESPRYSNILVSDVIDDIDTDEEKQFGALTFYPEENLAYIGYTGTGTKVIGYKEDLNMAYMDIIPSQREAVSYLNKMKDKLPERLMVGGYSKGGNLAVFASAFCNPEIRAKIETVYNHDGPGFSDLILNEPKYTTIKPLVKTYIPNASIVGIILNHENDFKVIESTAPPIIQHQPYSWVFEGDDLKVLDKLSKPSHIIREMQKQILDKVSPEDRRDIVIAIFNFINEVETEDFLNIITNEEKVSTQFRQAWKKLDRKTKRILRKLLLLLGASFYKSIYPPKKKRKALRKEKKRIRKLNKK